MATPRLLTLDAIMSDYARQGVAMTVARLHARGVRTRLKSRDFQSNLESQRLATHTRIRSIEPINRASDPIQQVIIRNLPNQATIDVSTSPASRRIAKKEGEARRNNPLQLESLLGVLRIRPDPTKPRLVTTPKMTTTSSTYGECVTSLRHLPLLP